MRCRVDHVLLQELTVRRAGDFDSTPHSMKLRRASDLSWTGQRIANAGNDAIPLAFLSRGIVYQHAIHELACEVATVVPDDVVAEAGNHEEP